jgi:cell division protein FtsB
MSKLAQNINEIKGTLARNGYFWVVLVFAIWISFFDKHSLWNQSKLSNTIGLLESEIEQYDAQYDQALIDQKNLELDKEKFAREQYNFSEEDQNIFIIK